MNKRKIVITGNKGFLGSALENYLSKDYVVYGVDEEDGGDIFEMPELIGIDTVIHCAALTSVKESFVLRAPYFRTNVLGTAYVINKCLRYNTRLFYLSSAAIYEPDSSPYAESKMMAHEMVDCFLEELKGIIFVLYNVYATHPKAGSLFHRFLKDRQLELDGRGKQTRDFINIVDVCDIIKTALDEEWGSDILEVGTGISTTVNKIASYYQKERKVPIVYTNTNPGIKQSVADTAHLLEHYKKKLKTNLKEDIQRICLNFN